MGKGRGEEDAIKAGACCLCILFITGIILFSVSFGTLDPTQVGIRYNNNLKEIEESKVYNNGRYFLGLGVWFIDFQISLQQMQYSASIYGEHAALRAWSAEGQLITIDLSFYFRLDRDQIINLYKRYEDQYYPRYSQISVRTLKAVTIQYTTVDFFTLRAAIGVHMKRDLRARLKQEFCTVEIFNLRAINIPTDFENKIISKVVQTQQQKTAENQKITAVLRAQIAVIEGNGYAIVNYTIAKASADALRTIEYARSDGLTRLRAQEAISYNNLQNVLGLNGTELLQYRWAEIAGKLDDTLTTLPNRTLSFLVGFASPTITVQQS